jgi:hypothetical protein
MAQCGGETGWLCVVQKWEKRSGREVEAVIKVWGDCGREREGAREGEGTQRWFQVTPEIGDTPLAGSRVWGSSCQLAETLPNA